MGQSDDLIGAALFELADMQAMMREGQHRAELPSLLLSDPKAKEGSKSRGAIEGSYALLERPGGAVSTASLGGGDKERIIGQLRADLEERDREISRLRAQLGGGGGLGGGGAPQGASIDQRLLAAPPPASPASPAADAVTAHRRVSGGTLGAHPSGAAVLSGQVSAGAAVLTPGAVLSPGLSAQIVHRTPGAPQQIVSVSFLLRAADLAAKDKKLLGKNSSDPYYLLQVTSATGQVTSLGRSKEIMKTLHPSWEALEVSDVGLMALRAVRAVRIEVWDWDKNPAKHELIGSAELSMPDLDRMLSQSGGGGSAALDAVTLYDASAKGSSSSIKSRGTVSGSVTVKTN